MNKYNTSLSWIYRNILPTLVQQRIDIYRGESQIFRPCFQSTKSIFIHVPKAAGTSISRAIYGRNIGHMKALDYQKISKREYRRYFSFAIVRNPWDRVVSAYNFVKQGGTSLVQPLPNPVYASPYFESFDAFVTDWLPNAELGAEDVVFEPQWHYVSDKKGEIIVNYIGKIENISQCLVEISQQLGMDIEMKNLNRSNRNLTNYREYYNKNTIKIVQKIYEKDIAMFDYEF